MYCELNSRFRHSRFTFLHVLRTYLLTSCFLILDLGNNYLIGKHAQQNNLFLKKNPGCFLITPNLSRRARGYFFRVLEPPMHIGSQCQGCLFPSVGETNHPHPSIFPRSSGRSSTVPLSDPFQTH